MKRSQMLAEGQGKKCHDNAVNFRQNLSRKPLFFKISK
jgi:hypothetical protein